VCEIDPVKATEAWMDGFEVMPMEEAARIGDFFVTVTGCTDVVNRKHIDRMKDGAVLANAGHFDVEISKPDLDAFSEETKEVRTNIRMYRGADGRRIYLLADGRLVNLAAGDGHPAEIMDMTFSLQVSSLLHIAENRELDPKVYSVPEEIDRQVAAKKLASLGLSIDSLTKEQVEYMASWKV
jgi:adenosylhomocysteinase